MTAQSCDNSTESWLDASRRPLIGFVLPLVNGDVHAAEDVVQETMLRGWQHAGELSKNHAGPWLRTVARNIAISAYHRRHRSQPPEVPLTENAIGSADDGLEGFMDAWVIGEALDSLSDQHRAVIVELFYHRRSVAEVSALLAIPEGTVRSRSFYGLRALRKVLEEQGITRT